MCHSSKDKVFVTMLAEKLFKHGATVWVDEAEIKVGDSLIQKISEAIDEVDYIIAIISNNSVNSPWVKKELSLAITKEINDRKVVVLPILTEKCELPPYLKDKLFVDFTDPDDFEDSFFQILRALDISSPARIAHPVYGYFDSPPFPDETLKNKVQIWGWANVDHNAVRKIEIWIDNTFQGNAAYGTPRPDAGGNFGFYWDWDTTKYKNGMHSVEIRVVAADGKSALLPSAINRKSRIKFEIMN